MTKPTAFWDLPIRLFHWALVALVGVAAVTGFLAPEWWLDVHAWAGWGIGALLLFRLVWGFFGSGPTLFSGFPLSPRAVLSHLSEAARLQGHRHPGHPPAGALMVVALLLVLGCLVASGAVAWGGQEKLGPLAAFLSYETGHAAKELHETLAVSLLVLVGLHLAGVVVESFITRENLVRAMVDGQRPGLPAPSPARRLAATLALVILFSLAGLGWNHLAARPPQGLPAMPRHAAFEKECAACHGLYHPSLLPASSWKAMMADLSDHFGEDASLAPETTAAIAAHLDAFAAEAWDTEAANRLRQVSAEAPQDITKSSYWQRRHRALPEALFATKPVKSKANCFACHTDAVTGRFDDHAIRIPKE